MHATKIILMLFAVIVTFVGVASADVILFQDNFDTGMSPEWVSVRPTQWVDNGWCHSRNFNDPSPNRDSFAFVHNGDPTWTDYDFSAKVETIPTGSWDHAVVYLRASVTGNPKSGPGGYFYGLDFCGPSDSSHATGVTFYRGTGYNGTGDDIITYLLNPLGYVHDGPMDVLVSLRGSNIRLSIDGTQVFSYDDPNPITYGGIGIGAFWGAEARFDNVLVVPEPATLVLLGLGSLMLVRRRRK